MGNHVPHLGNEIESGKPLQTHSILQVNLPKGEYVGIWENDIVSAYDAKNIKLCGFKVHHSSPQPITKCIIYNYPKSGAIIHAIVE